MINSADTILHDHYILDHLTIYKYRFNTGSNTFSNLSGREFNALCLIVQGRVSFCPAGGEKCAAAAGDIIYLPRGLTYTSYWSGQPAIEYYTIDFAFSRKTIRVDTPRLTVSRLQADNFRTEPLVISREQVTEQIRLCFPTILTEYLAGNVHGSLLAVSDFYRLWQMILALLAGPGGARAPSARQSRVFPAIRHIEQHYLQTFSVRDLASLCGLSESRFFNLFKLSTGTSPVDYRNRLRIHHAAKLLQSGQYSIAGVSDLLNFSNPGYFRKVFRHYAGRNPKEYLKLAPDQPLTDQI